MWSDKLECRLIRAGSGPHPAAEIAARDTKSCSASAHGSNSQTGTRERHPVPFVAQAEVERHISADLIVVLHEPIEFPLLDRVCDESAVPIIRKRRGLRIGEEVKVVYRLERTRQKV